MNERSNETNPNTSSDKNPLNIIRILFSLLLIGDLVWGVYLSTYLFFIYFTNWGLTCIAIFYIISVLSIRIKKLEPSVRILFETSWALEWCVSIVYWSAVAPADRLDVMSAILAHTVPLCTLLIDFCLNEIIFVRKHIIVPISISTIYLFCVNLPYTLALKHIYPLINYTDVWTYLLIPAMLLIEIISFELALQIKRKIVKNKQERKKNSQAGRDQALMDQIATEVVPNFIVVS
ncbi:unnamed protein product [Blepharisma stoltei]|uniref:Uncharacterized protein n=1 Tax=Blepharisma stoltei TaxID=1481888 RepID=A0AAU9JBZ8_9CILI|nr:unnamed protein product [Blepharisma stoltei]